MAFKRSLPLVSVAAFAGSVLLAQPALAETVLSFEAQNLADGDTVTISPLTTPEHCSIFLVKDADGLDAEIDHATGAVTVKVADPEKTSYLIDVACGNSDGDVSSLRFGGIAVSILDDSTPPPAEEGEDDDEATEPDPGVGDDEDDAVTPPVSSIDALGSSDLPPAFAGSSLR